MTLSDSYERIQAPPDPMPPNWQENLFFVLCDDTGSNGFMTHVKRVPRLGWQEALTVISAAGKVVSTTVRGPIDHGSYVPGLNMVADVPYEQWTIEANLRGLLGYGPFGFIATEPDTSSSATCALRLLSVIPAVDFYELYRSSVASDELMEMASSHSDVQQHYEQGGTWSGRLAVDGESVEAKGLFIRDHSWGVRNERPAASDTSFQAFWTACCLDEGKIFCNAKYFPYKDGHIGVGVWADENGVRTTTEVSASFVPQSGIWSYDRSTIRYGAGVDRVIDAESLVHWTMYLPYSGVCRYDNNALSNVRSDGSTGFGVIEWAAELSRSQAEIIDAGLPLAQPAMF